MSPAELLRKAVLAEGSQAAVAAKLHYSPATVSRVLAGTYDGDLTAIFAAIATTYGGKTMDQRPAIPDGYKQNALGHLVPIEQIEEVDLLRDEFVHKAILMAKEMETAMAEFKERITGDFEAFVGLSAEQYGVRMGGVKGNVCLTSFDGNFRVTREVAERIEFDERLQTAKVLVDQCLREWTKFSASEVRTLIEDAFQVDKKGRINTKRILGLRKLKIDHPIWKQAMEAIGDAITITGSCVYYRFHVRDDQGRYQQINLDFAGV